MNELDAQHQVECGLLCGRNSENCNTFHFSFITKKCLEGFACIGELEEAETGSGLDIYQLGLEHFCGKF